MEKMLSPVKETKVKICVITLGCINHYPGTGNPSMSFFATLYMQNIGGLIPYFHILLNTGVILTLRGYQKVILYVGLHNLEVRFILCFRHHHEKADRFLCCEDKPLKSCHLERHLLS